MFRRAAIAGIIRCHLPLARLGCGVLNEAMMPIRFGAHRPVCCEAAVLTAQAPPAKATIVMVAGCYKTKSPYKGPCEQRAPRAQA